MILYPAIDLKDGACVRLERGDMATAHIFNRDPADQARTWAAAGFSWLHVIDLDGSIAGAPVNEAAVGEILSAVSIPVQLGGGVRTFARAKAWIEAGVSRVILGTAAVRDPALVKAAAKAWPEQIAVSIDVRAGRVAVAGWTEDSALDAVTLARRCEDAGVSAVIITDIDRDGLLGGFNIEAFGRIADVLDIPVIAAGGLASVADITLLADWPGVAIAGAVLGRALYAGTIAPAEALAAAA